MQTSRQPLGLPRTRRGHTQSGHTHAASAAETKRAARHYCLSAQGSWKMAGAHYARRRNASESEKTLILRSIREVFWLRFGQVA